MPILSALTDTSMLEAYRKEAQLWKEAAEALERENNQLRAKLGYPPMPHVGTSPNRN